MIGLLVVAHGQLADELVRVVRNIVPGDLPLAGLGIDWNVDLAEARRRIEEILPRLDQGEGVIIATDVFGGTPTNVAMAFFQPGKVEVVTGVNLPMLIKYTNLRTPMELPAAALMLAEKGRAAISAAGEILSRKQGE